MSSIARPEVQPGHDRAYWPCSRSLPVVVAARLLAAQLLVGLTLGRAFAAVPRLLELVQPRFGEGAAGGRPTARFANLVEPVFLTSRPSRTRPVSQPWAVLGGSSQRWRCSPRRCLHEQRGLKLGSLPCQGTITRRAAPALRRSPRAPREGCEPAAYATVAEVRTRPPTRFAKRGGRAPPAAPRQSAAERARSRRGTAGKSVGRASADEQLVLRAGRAATTSRSRPRARPVGRCGLLNLGRASRDIEVPIWVGCSLHFRKYYEDAPPQVRASRPLGQTLALRDDGHRRHVQTAGVRPLPF